MLSTHRWRRAPVCPRPALTASPSASKPTASAQPRSTPPCGALARPPPCPPRLTRPKNVDAARSTSGPAFVAARASKHALRTIAHEMAKQWHFPWRLYGKWPNHLRRVAQTWLAGDLAAARRVQGVSFCNILAGVQDHDTTPEHRNFATFVLLWARSILQAATSPKQIEGAETADALEAVGAYMVLIRARYAQIFHPDVLEKLTRITHCLMEQARHMRGCASAK